jgi:hypothetical protein
MTKKQTKFILKVLKKESNSIKCFIERNAKRYKELNDMNKESFLNYQRMNKSYLKKLDIAINELEKKLNDKETKEICT